MKNLPHRVHDLPACTDDRNTLILLATGNLDKQRMLRWLLDGLPLNPVTPADLNVFADPDESADTHQAIARAKAEAWSSIAGVTAIASDGGLLIPALGANWQSRYTRRFAGPAANDAQRQRRLLELLRPYTGEHRAAAFVEGLAIARHGQTLASWQVQGATGLIVETLPETGNATIPDADAGDAATNGNGFWVFPIWHFPQYGLTYNRLTEPQRAGLGDHWNALRTLVREFLTTSPVLDAV